MADEPGWLPKSLVQAGGVQPRKAKGGLRVTLACAHCKAGKVRCESDRPCRRCLYKGIECVDADAAAPEAGADMPLEAAIDSVPVPLAGLPAPSVPLEARAAHGTAGAAGHATAGRDGETLLVETASMQVLELSAALAARYCQVPFSGPVETSLHLWLHDADVLRVTELVGAGAAGDRLKGVRMMIIRTFCAEFLACCLELASLHDGKATLRITWEKKMQKGSQVPGVDGHAPAELALLWPSSLARIDRLLNQALSIDELQSSHSVFDYALTMRRAYESVGFRSTALNDVLSSTSSEAREQSWYEMLYAPLHQGLNATARVVSRYFQLLLMRVPEGSGADALTLHIFFRIRLPQLLGGWCSGWKPHGSFPVAKTTFVGRGSDADECREWACFIPIVNSSEDAAQNEFTLVAYKGKGKAGQDMLPLFAHFLTFSESGMCATGCFEVVSPARRHKDKGRDKKRDASGNLVEPRASCHRFRMILAGNACGQPPSQAGMSRHL